MEEEEWVNDTGLAGKIGGGYVEVSEERREEHG